MLAKIASRNVKRQIGNYLIYFITVTVTVALMFAVNNVIYSPQLQSLATSGEMQSTLTGLTCAVAVIVAFVLGYATSFMLKLRKREFGTYLTLGMTRGNILTIFILETTIMGILALVVGVILGLFVFQGAMAVITNLLELEFVFSPYSLEGALLTVVLVCVVFVLSSSASALYLRRVKIYDLIHGEKKVMKRVRFPVLWLIVTAVSFLGVIAGILLVDKSVADSMAGDQSAGGMLNAFMIFAICLFLFHVALARSLVNILLKRKKLCASGTNTFTLRQLSGTLGSGSVMAGAIAFLLAFAVIGTSVALTQRVSEELMLEKSFPFDIMASIDDRDPLSFEDATKIIEKYNDITATVPYHIYTSGNDYLHGKSTLGDFGGGSPNDSFISESEYDNVMKELGEEPANLDGGYKILTDMRLFDEADMSAATLENNGVTCGYKGTVKDVPMLSFVYFIVIVPDAFVEGMALEQECYGINLKNERYDAAALAEELPYDYRIEVSMGDETKNVMATSSSYALKEVGRQDRNFTSAILIVGFIYISVIFIFMAIAILALKTLAGISDDKQRYEILNRLGADGKTQRKALFRQIFSFFMLPFAMPMLLSIPTGYVCGRIMIGSGYASSVPQVYIATALTVLVMAAIYILYFTATYLIAKRNVIRE